MRRTSRNRLSVIAAMWLACLSAPADAQVPGGPATYPPAGYSRRTIQDVPGAQPGPPSGLATPGMSNVPRGLAELPTPGVRLGATNSSTFTNMSGFGSRYQYWSPTTAIWNVQEQLSLVEPMSLYGERPLPDPAIGRTSGRTGPVELPQTYGMPGAAIGVLPEQPTLRDAAPENGEQERGATDAEGLPEMRLPTAEEIAGGGIPLGPAARGLDIPFEEFETFEEFDDWLRQQITAPGGGAPEQAGPAAQGRPSNGRFARPAERPPIGYVGVGSNATMPLGQINLGPNVAVESARLVNELNDFLRRSQTRPSSPWQPGQHGQARPPLPQSNLGRYVPSGTAAALPNRSVPAVGGFAPQAQSRQYWQNLGGYQLPPPRLEDWP